MELVGDGTRRKREGEVGRLVQFTQKEMSDVHFAQDWRLLRGDLLEAVDRLASPQLALLVLGQEVRHEVVAEL